MPQPASKEVEGTRQLVRLLPHVRVGDNAGTIQIGVDGAPQDCRN